MNNNQNIKVLNLSDNYFHLGGNRIDIIESLAEFIKQNNSLEELDLSRSSLSFHGILLILDSLQNKSSFFSINLYKTAPTLTSEETPMDAVTRSIIACRIGDRLKGIKSLSRLNLGYNDLGFYDAMMILDLLSSNPNIKYLNLENNNFNKRALEALCVGLSSNNYLAEIYLFGVFDTVDKEDIKIYAKALKSNTSIIKADYCLQKNSKKASTYLERNQLRKNWFLFFKYLPDFFINDDDSQSMIQLLPPELKQVIILKFFQL